MHNDSLMAARLTSLVNYDNCKLVIMLVFVLYCTLFIGIFCIRYLLLYFSLYHIILLLQTVKYSTVHATLVQWFCFGACRN